MGLENITKKLERIGELVEELKSLFFGSFAEFEKDFRTVRTAERDFQLIVDLISDINTEIILDRGGRTPDTYKDSMSGLEKLGLLEADISQKLIEAARIRNILVHEYDFEEDHNKFYSSGKTITPFFEEYIKTIHRYIKKEKNPSKNGQGI
ncbi:MAG: DUF86 domain-containing protein [Patescibacteria group bacterium]